MTKSPRILVVYNLCGLKHNNLQTWAEHIVEILHQDYDNFDVAISACNIRKWPAVCKSLENLIEPYTDTMSKQICINYIEDVLPVNITFNRTCQLFSHIPYNGKNKYAAYLYVASDVKMIDPSAIKKLSEFHFKGPDDKGPFAISAAYVNKDSGLDAVTHQQVKANHIVFAQGHSFNAHCLLMDASIYKNFGNRCFPDVFASWASESVFSYLAASLDKKLGMPSAAYLTLKHLDNLDGSSVGFRNRLGHLHLFNSHITPHERLMSEEAKEVGFGYEEVKGVFPHDPGCYINGYHKNPDILKEFVKKACFLSKDEFDYDTIK